MPYVKSDRPPGRPRKYSRRDDEPARLSLRISHALRQQLLVTAHAQQTSVAAVAVQALERGLYMSTLKLDVIDDALTATVKGLGRLETALADDPRLALVDAIYHALQPIDDQLNSVKGTQP
jgi:hypothetical protein